MQCSLDSDNINSIGKDKDDIIWVETSGQHLNKYNPESDTFERILIESKHLMN